ncbi:zinc finger CCCH domain-containing protein [Chloropicon primus]|uniref:Zinc finger CCCH domain-containing protein n=1 Tax=Chloropicon primus TaxID=1764295 RepID=A0A5B8MGN7_9CHLO|nr:zinc finger CCCH domain-containing protein [Chloropicon primus]UPQ98805.1 zinc finger CCCH domain-containing protein [Chloropicon primus]|mmetsp:Transcript_4924/g.14739  ORF Transcript_4924/g.14739 Transcript_4924/m.14739 type:complete len:328 (-) Transcript_4924:1932-2915(-)|eukprot:QDZ19593.1 zinc finger CCCH domain-containing protein [Chloropicon primus]
MEHHQQHQQHCAHSASSSLTRRDSSSNSGRERSWEDSNNNSTTTDPNITHPAFCTDHFRMYEFKVKACPRTRAHDWTQCPFAHPGEKARRRDPRKYSYSAEPCPDYRKGTCKRGDACEYAHGVFECWLHPSRYRTQMCTDGAGCHRPVCFFAHHHEELRYPTETACVPIPVEPRKPSAPPPGTGHAAAGGSPLDNLGSDQLFSLALAHLLALQNQQLQGQSHAAGGPGPQQQQFHPHNVHAADAGFTAPASPALQHSMLQQSVPYYPQMHAIKQGMSQYQHPLSPNSPLHGDFGVLPMTERGDFGSMDNLLSSLPRSLSDVGLADLR